MINPRFRNSNNPRNKKTDYNSSRRNNINSNADSENISNNPQSNPNRDQNIPPWAEIMMQKLNVIEAVSEKVNKVSNQVESNTNNIKILLDHLKINKEKEDDA